VIGQEAEQPLLVALSASGCSGLVAVIQ